MKTTLSRMLLICTMLLSSIALATPAQAAHATCSAQVTTVTTDIGPTRTSGNTIHYDNYQFRGSYDTGTLAGSTFIGTQKARENIRTSQVRARGSYTITSPGGTLVIRFTIQEDDITGNLSGKFTSSHGTGALANAHWKGKIVGAFVSADDQGQPTYESTFSGPCSNLN